MARFLYHTSCSVCSSSDALGVYDDGSTYCFSHGRSTKQATISPYVASNAAREEKELRLPDDVTQEYPPQALEWTNKYEISVAEMLRSNIYYSPARNQLIFGFFDGEGRVIAWQARNLNPVSKANRYYTQGDINEILPIYRTPSKLPVRSLCLTEDCLSAIKVASLADVGRDSMPCLGSSVPRAKIARLRPFYDVLDVFLDPDMWPKSLMLAKQAEMLGFKVRSIRAECDPKELTREELKELLK